MLFRASAFLNNALALIKYDPVYENQTLRRKP